MTRSLRAVAVTAAIALSVVVLSACSSSKSHDSNAGSSSTTPTVTTVKIGYPAPVASLLPIFIASAVPSICAPFGIKLDPVLLDPTSLITAVVSQSVPIAESSITGLLPALEKSPDSIHVIALSGGPENVAFFGAKNIASVADLKGKTVAATAPGSTSDVYARIVLKDSGLTPGSDVNVIYTKVQTASVAQAVAGNISALPYSPPLPDAAISAGFHELNEGDLSPGSPGSLVLGHGIAVNPAYATAHAGIVTNTLKCLSAAIQYIPSHEADRDASLVKFVGVTSSAAEGGYTSGKVTYEAGLRAAAGSSIDSIVNTLINVGVYTEANAPTPATKFADQGYLSK
jgi:NitT/TauT family transport system substrate-binding protein